MHVNVRDILVEGVGFSRTYKISGEHPELEGVQLTKDIEGEVTIGRLDDGLLVRGHIATEIQLECHRCLRTFHRPAQLKFAQIFSEAPRDDELPVVDNAIDLAPLIGQEIVLGLPIKILCQPDCQGIGDIADEYTKPKSGSSLKNQARITKRNYTRGRT